MTRSSKSLSGRAASPQDEKDYFQVTDELAQENSHFSISEALLAVIEQYKATSLEQELLDDQPFSPSILLSPPSGAPLTSNSPATPSFLSSWGSMSSVATNDGKSLTISWPTVSSPLPLPPSLLPQILWKGVYHVR